MITIHDFFDTKINEATAITVGKFDGMHRGHELLMNRILSRKPEEKACMITFETSPRTILHGESNGSLITREERHFELEKQGLAYLAECQFSERFMHLSPEEFVENLVRNFHMSYMAVGSDFRFGYKGQGTPAVIRELSNKYGFTFEEIPKIQYHNRDISSTFIREDISLGKIKEANTLLGYPYFIWGQIIHGNHIGTKMGIPTINQIPPKEKLLPPNGVYITEVEIDHRLFHGITNVGKKPTVQDMGPVGVETHILDFQGDVYEKEAKVLFLDYIRPERKFDSLDELKAQIKMDTKCALDFFNS